MQVNMSQQGAPVSEHGDRVLLLPLDFKDSRHLTKGMEFSFISGYD